MVQLAEKVTSQEEQKRQRAYSFWSDVAGLKTDEQQDFLYQLWLNAAMSHSELYDFIPRFLDSLFSAEVTVEEKSARICYQGPFGRLLAQTHFDSPGVDRSILPCDDLISLFTVHTNLEAEEGAWVLSLDKRQAYQEQVSQEVSAAYIICGQIKEEKAWIGVKREASAELSYVWVIKEGKGSKMKVVDLLGLLFKAKLTR